MLAFVEELPEVYQGESVSDIAVLLDVPQNTVKSYLHRARRLLHVRLAERGFDAR
jgi:DNA-directed RNA polymerase specialized sigma24 family protein